MTNEKKQWYDNGVLINILLILFFPVGLYLLWKSATIAKWWKVTATIIIAIIVINALGKDVEQSSETSKMADVSGMANLTQEERDSVMSTQRARMIEERSESTISANDLVDAYENNEVAADENYKGERFYVEGYIDNIGKDLFGEVYVTLEANGFFTGVQCYIDEGDVAALQKGQKITVLGTCDGSIMNVQMKKCEIVPNREDL